MTYQEVVILLGSNITPRKQFLQEAEKLLINDLGKLYKASSVYESEPWGFDSNQAFLNKILVFETDAGPKQILDICQKTENVLGRKRKRGNGYASRTIDVDILYVDDLVMKTTELTIPHPRLSERKFTLLPLVEIMPDFIHPVLKQTHQELLEQCKDPLNVELFND
jgi:2-amino-4-hydroxy-6-hydroxymethyldihydropteridine diphosphokinase